MKPIIFSTDMVRAILDGRKSMTRRVIKPQTVTHNGPDKQIVESLDDFFARNRKDMELLCAACAPYQPGDILWVRETWRETGVISAPFAYRADEYPLTLVGEKNNILQVQYSYRPSIHMPREAARIFLRVTDVRVERLWEITEVDALKEGCRMGDQWAGPHSTPAITPRQSFMWLWDKINGKGKYPWAANPWVWVITFERREKPEEEK